MELEQEDIEWLKLVSKYLRKLADMEPKELFSYIRSDGRITVSEDRIREEFQEYDEEIDEE